MGQSVKYLPCKHEDLTVIPSTQVKKAQPVRSHMLAIPALGRDTGRPWGLGPASLAYLVNSRPLQVCPKKNVGSP